MVKNNIKVSYKCNFVYHKYVKAKSIIIKLMTKLYKPIRNYIKTIKSNI